MKGNNCFVSRQGYTVCIDPYEITLYSHHILENFNGPGSIDKLFVRAFAPSRKLLPLGLHCESLRPGPCFSKRCALTPSPPGSPLGSSRMRGSAEASAAAGPECNCHCLPHWGKGQVALMPQAQAEQ